MSDARQLHSINMADGHLRSWERAHSNGMFAVVFELLWTTKDDAYSFGAMRTHAVHALGRARGLGNAQIAADVESGCPQPCRCSPWGVQIAP